METKREELGALWAKKNDKGDFMTGQLKVNGEVIPVVVFFNQNKTKETQPDWRILRSEPRQPKENPLPEKEVNPEDIPF